MFSALQAANQSAVDPPINNGSASKPMFNMLTLLLQKVDGHLARDEYLLSNVTGAGTHKQVQT